MDSANADLVRRGFEDYIHGDFDALQELLDPGVEWLWYEPGEWDCHDREKVLRTLRERYEAGAVAELSEVADGGELVFVSVTGPRLDDGGMPGGRACLVVTVRDGRIVRMRDYRSREHALAAAGIGPEPLPEPPRPLADTEPGWDRVIDATPFVHVADVERSIGFYGRLGFAVRDTFGPAGRLGWAFLQAGQGRLMVARASEPVDPAAQGVLFYLYARDLFGLRARLVAEGVAAGEIVDGSPGPKAEMRVDDPDGYCLMIAQIDVAADA